MKISNIGWSIGNYCNAKCNHCYSWKQRQGDECLSLEEINIILDKIISYGIKTVNFGGNEPIFTNGNDLYGTTLPYIIDELYKNGILCGITTNGFTAKYLYEHYRDAFNKVNDWDFSLDFPYDSYHNKNRNLSNAFEMVIDGLNVCTKNNKMKSIVIVGMQSNLNKETLEKFITMSKDYDAILRFNFLKPTLKHHIELLPTVKMVYDSVSYLTRRMDLVCMSEPIFASQLGIECDGCSCGEHSLRIRNVINGRVPITPCVYLDLDAGDILTESFDDIISGEVFTSFKKRQQDIPEKCHDMKCNIIESCRGGCSARTALMQGTYNDIDPYCPHLLSENKTTNLKNIKPTRSIASNNTLVHENYLCTMMYSARI